MLEKIRLDKWLWAARFYKSRSLAVDAILKGRVLLHGRPVKPAHEVAAGDLIRIRKDDPPIEVRVLGVSAVRGPAPVASRLYAETEDSRAARERAAEQRRLAPEPAHALTDGRPTKRDRRQMEEWRRH
ncbi:RNA-binding S4 domain-containing protein [Castellaniella sp. S9]|uniref:RNA-binding S4 domain-containing protein n=1 Tax=Castellaniella sp. S9 TaxID=2993652 RepID=UPI0022B4676D|nr:RNA-binding S4 domain-containing protein [Castellaniella sp. S9]